MPASCQCVVRLPWISLPLGFRSTDLGVSFVFLRPCISKAVSIIVFKMKLSFVERPRTALVVTPPACWERMQSLCHHSVSGLCTSPEARAPGSAEQSVFGNEPQVHRSHPIAEAVTAFASVQAIPSHRFFEHLTGPGSPTWARAPASFEELLLPCPGAGLLKADNC